MSANNIAIKVENVSKVYRLGTREETEDSLMKSVARMIKSPVRNYRKYRSLYNFSDLDFDNPGADADPNVLWALNNVSFEVNKGEVVGIIGRNGAGKSTLLKILSRITPPARGRVEIHGLTSSLLEVGTGFHNELTGRENVYLNATILGMRKKEVDRKFDEIVEFSGVEKFLDTPVKRYSSGMRVRLAFAVAAHLEPEILIIDEVLAVGDAAFQEKCLNKMQDVGKEGRTVFFVSHNMPAVTRLCERVIMLNNGQVTADGPSHDIVARYMHEGSSTASERTWSDIDKAPGTEVVRLTGVRIKDESAQTTPSIDIRTAVGFEMTFKVIQDGYVLLPYFCLKNEEGVSAFVTVDVDPDWRKKKRLKGTYTVTAWVPGNFLAEGSFFVNAAMLTLAPQTMLQFAEQEVVSFQVLDPMQGDSARGDWANNLQGVVRPLLTWETDFSGTNS
ncbi:MAG: ABC transporter ATP-binding protein [Gammaproteobacteria bacterium]|nr:MAG: ABC transporter ATP-binding protein [Gammaproteobacteria bacterium]